ncbi:MAG: CocE/NonD family hydrolase [Ginsengibacter sp.]
MKLNLLIIALFLRISATCQDNTDASFVKDNYTKMDVSIPMRDGIKLYTVIYVPKNSDEKYPFLMERTPYAAGPYGEKIYDRRIGPNISLMKEKYIFVIQDVRGRYMSEGVNLEVTPYLPVKKTKTAVDESSDTYDTIDWLLKNIKHNNGRVGLYGISYPGFYATASLPGAHPAIKAVSPQAPVTDEFIGDDVNHNGAFFLLDNFDFMNYFGKERTGPIKNYGPQMFTIQRPDAFDFFLHLGPLKNTQSSIYFNKRSYIWNEYLEHDTYDAYWKSRNIRPYLKNIKIPVMVVGGWFDAEDLFGALHTYDAIEKQSPDNNNYLVMGPWTHGAWAAKVWDKFGTYHFGSNINRYFQDSLETKFFNYYLKDKDNFNISEATVFDPGVNVWKHFNHWPPENITAMDYYMGSDKSLSPYKKISETGYEEYLSDPANPVPYTNGVYERRNNEYMIEDQRFAASRRDVLVFETDTLTADLTATGKIIADLFVSTTSSDADFVVKVIDVQGGNENEPADGLKAVPTGGFQRLVRAEIMRGKFRNSYEIPEPFVPGKISEVKFNLNDICHTFKTGHKIMVQVQSSWFPIADINPQKFMRIPDADEKDFQKATIRIYHDMDHASKIILPVLSK